MNFYKRNIKLLQNGKPMDLADTMFLRYNYIFEDFLFEEEHIFVNWDNVLEHSAFIDGNLIKTKKGLKYIPFSRKNKKARQWRHEKLDIEIIITNEEETPTIDRLLKERDICKVHEYLKERGLLMIPIKEKTND